MGIVKPSKTEIGRIYKVVQTTYEKRPLMVHVYEGCLVKVVRVSSNYCLAVPIAALDSDNPYPCAYCDEYNGMAELLEGPIEDVNVNCKSKEFCACEHPNLVENCVAGNKFFYCRVCKKEAIYD